MAATGAHILSSAVVKRFVASFVGLSRLSGIPRVPRTGDQNWGKMPPGVVGGETKKNDREYRNLDINKGPGPREDVQRDDARNLKTCEGGKNKENGD